MVTLVILPDQFFLVLGFRQPGEALLIKRFNALCALQPEIDAVLGFFRDVFQQLLVQMRFDDIAVLVAHVVAAPVGVFDPQQFAFGAANADRKNLKSCLGGFFGGIHCAGVVIFAIGEQHQGFVVITFLERSSGG